MRKLKVNGARVALLALLALLALAATSRGQAASVSLSSAVDQDGLPGQYVTLAYEVEGEGSFSFEVQGPEGWTPVARRRDLTLHGKTFVPVTFKVPDLARVGASESIVLIARQDGAERTRASARLKVLRRSGLSLDVPEQHVSPGAQNVVPVSVTNLGNAPDTVNLRVTNLDDRAKLSAGSVLLAPGETRVLSVTVPQDGRSTKYVVFLTASSGNDPSVSADVQTVALPRRQGRAGEEEDKAPRLVFGVSGGLEAQFVGEGGSWQGGVQYTVAPFLSGSLSDRVRAEGSLDRLGGEGASVSGSFGWGAGRSRPRWPSATWAVSWATRWE